MDGSPNVQKTVSLLIQRLDGEEGPIDRFIKNQIDISLKAFLAHVEEHGLSEPDEEVARTRQLVEEAREKLRRLPTRSHFQIKELSEEELLQMQAYVVRINSQIEAHGELTEEGNVLSKVAVYVHHLNKNMKMWYEKRNIVLPVFFLKLFIASSGVSSNDLGASRPCKIVTKDEDGVDEIGTLDHVKATSLRVPMLREPRSDVPADVLDVVQNRMDTMYNDFTLLKVPVAESIEFWFKKYLNRYRVALECVPAVSPEIEERKNNISAHMEELTDNFKKINGTYSYLSDMEQKIVQKMSSKDPHEMKKRFFESMLEHIRQMRSVNLMVLDKQQVVSNRIVGALLVDGMRFLKTKLYAVEKYESYVDKFPFPTKSQMYRITKRDIEELRASLGTNKWLNLRVRAIATRIEEALKKLDVKAKRNDRIIDDLEELLQLQEEIQSGSNRPDVLQLFHGYRRRIQRVRSYHPRVITKKMEVLGVLHIAENSCYKRPEVQTLLKMYEGCVRKHHDAVEINVEEVARLKTGNLPETVVKIFDNIQELVEENQKDVKTLKTIIRIESRPEGRYNLQALKAATTRSDFLDRIDLLEARHTKERSKQELSNTLERLKRSIDSLTFPVSNDIFVDYVTRMLLLKDSLPDHEAQQLYPMMCRFDTKVAEFAFTYQKVDEEERSFSCDEDEVLEGVEFVRKVLEVAERLEEEVETFLGSKNSRDYYVIREGLERLLTELSEVQCEEDDAEELREAVGYVKKLQGDLDANSIE